MKNSLLTHIFMLFELLLLVLLHILLLKSRKIFDVIWRRVSEKSVQLTHFDVLLFFQPFKLDEFDKMFLFIDVKVKNNNFQTVCLWC